MKKIFTLLFSAFAVTMGFAQEAPTGVFAKASVAPVIDGVVDAVWSEATKYNIERAVVGNTPTIGAPGETTWQGVWTKDGVFILLDVKDNAFYPNYVAGGGNDYDYDKLELYFDVNYVLVNESGAVGPATGGSGHYQVAPGFKKDQNDGTAFTAADGVVHAFMVEGAHYIAEYFVPFTKLLDVDNIQVDKTNTIGFDVTVIDRDPGDATRNQAVWSNTNESGKGESWANLDNAGQVTFEDAEMNVLAETISIANTDLTITTDKGTLQLVANVGPEEATIKTVKWTLVGGTAQASISATGLVSAVSNGTVIVKASTTDGSYLDTDEITITITGQKKIQYTDATWNEKNIIKNWNFDTDVSEWGGWVDGGVAGQASPVVENGVLVMKVGKASDSQGWHYQHNQSDIGAEANVEYTLMFKSWASATADCIVDFESGSSIPTGDGGDQYVRYGTDTDTNGASEWRYTVTTVPSWFTYHVNFNKMIETTIQKIQWMNSLSEETIYLDSVLLVKTEEIEVITKNANQLSSSIKVYPNPVNGNNVLTVELMSAVNTKVAIYNAIGQKVMERVSTGKVARFDVSALRKGMYFVKLEDGSTHKFVK
ncbi:MAG TPA: sugar-binding protein [Prolixibacteraceae bacterium]|nr:sugar-binding protein [Prolixibacteraceae bacterium]